MMFLIIRYGVFDFVQNKYSRISCGVKMTTKEPKSSVTLTHRFQIRLLTHKFVVLITPK